MSILDNSKLDASQKSIGSALSGVVMAGNMLSVGLQLYSLFNDGGPSPELAQLQQISQMLQQLSQQVADLHRDMQQRFDQVDQRFNRLDSTLNAIYDSLSQQLSFISWTLYQVSGDLTTIRTTLSDLQSDVRTLEQRINEMISDGFRREFHDKIGTYIGYRQHAHAILPYTDFFATAEYFAQWASLHAGDSLELSPSNRPYDDASVYDQLSRYPLAFNLNYLNLYPAAKFGLPPLFAAPSQVVNPNDWAIATAAFVRLLTEWPDYARQGSFDSDIAAIQNKGDVLKAALLGITTTTAKTANYALFDNLIGRGASVHPSSYRGTMNQLQDEVERRRTAYRVTVTGTQTDLSPWGGMAQNSQYVPRLLRDGNYRLYFAAFGHTNFVPPDNLIGTLGITPPAELNALVPASIRNSEQLNSSGYQIKFLVLPEFLGYKMIGNVRYLQTAYLIHGYFVSATANTGDYQSIIFTKWMSGPDVVDPHAFPGSWPGYELRTNASWQFLVNQWESNYRTRFAAEAKDGDCDNGWITGCAAPEPNIASWISYNSYNITNSAQSVLRIQQPDFYRTISQDLTAAGTLQLLAKGVTGAILALTSFVELGLPQSVGSNEYLRSLLSGPVEFGSVGTIRNVVDTAIAQTNPQQDLILDFVSLSATWVQEIEGVVERILNTIDQGQNSEYDAVVENTLSRLQTLRDIRKMPLASDVTAGVGVTLGPIVFDSNASRYTQVINVQNRTGSPIQGPIAVVLDSLSDSALLTNANGATEFTQPTGSSYKTLSLTNNALGGTASIAVTLEFAAPSSAITFTSRVLAGSGLDSPIGSPASVICSYAVTPAIRQVSATGGTVSFAVDTGPSCSWNITGLPSWAHSTAAGPGSGSAPITVDLNTGNQRSVVITVAGQSVTITQDAGQLTSPFADVPTSAYYFDAVNQMYQKGITAGCGNNNYCPGQNVTRAQMAIFIVRSIEGGDNFTFAATPWFTDVQPADFGFKWIQKMKELGITAGCGSGNYCPNATVTRDQMAIFIIRARLGANLAGANPTFTYPAASFFTDEPGSDFGFPWVQRMKLESITAGCGANTYCQATR